MKTKRIRKGVKWHERWALIAKWQAAGWRVLSRKGKGNLYFYTFVK